MITTAVERVRFGEDGFWKSPTPLLSENEVRLAKERFDMILRGEYQKRVPPHGVNRFGDSMVKVSNAWWADPVIEAVVRDENLGQIGAELLGVDEVYLWADSLYWKAPETGEQAVIGWHQDKQYWATSSTDDMITACVALYDANNRTGGMRFVPGSHKWGLWSGSDALEGESNSEAHRTPTPPPGQVWREVCPKLIAGQVTFHHSLTYHGSGPNLSTYPRRSITIHMVSGEGRLVNWTPVDDGHLSTVGAGNLFRGPLFPRLWPKSW